MTRALADFQRIIAQQMTDGHWQAATLSAEQCRECFPANPLGWLFGSFIALATNAKEEALALAEGGLAVDPKDFQCQLQRAESLLALGRRAEALAAAEAAVADASAPLAALDASATFLVHASAHEAALNLFDRGVTAAPHERHFRAKRAMVLRYLGDFDLAEQDYDAILSNNPADGEALKARGELRLLQPGHSSITDLESALSRQPDPEEQIALHFALAKAYSDRGEYITSWRHLSSGNNLQRARLTYQPDQDKAIFDRIIAAFPDIEARQHDTTGESPIFIVGLPRTGTTLVDRILGSHSQVHSAGELAALSAAIGAAVNRIQSVNDLDWLDFATLLGKVEGAEVARDYLVESKSWRGQRPRFTDKQPTNFFYCGLILRAFPNARIVHLVRHPMAATYAIYKTRFRRTFPFSYDLTELADFIIGYRRLMAHWHRVLPGRILDVAYEDVVQSQEAQTRRLLDYCGLNFEPACLDFHKNPNATTTASAVQVRQPMYTSSLEEWRAFSTQLQPARSRFEAAGIALD